MEIVDIVEELYMKLFVHGQQYKLLLESIECPIGTLGKGKWLGLQIKDSTHQSLYVKVRRF